MVTLLGLHRPRSAAAVTAMRPCRATTSTSRGRPGSVPAEARPDRSPRSTVRATAWLQVVGSQRLSPGYSAVETADARGLRAIPLATDRVTDGPGASIEAVPDCDSPRARGRWTPQVPRPGPRRSVIGVVRPRPRRRSPPAAEATPLRLRLSSPSDGRGASRGSVLRCRSRARPGGSCADADAGRPRVRLNVTRARSERPDRLHDRCLWRRRHHLRHAGPDGRRDRRWTRMA